MGPQGQYAREVTRLLARLGLDVRYQFPGYAPFDAWPEIPSAEFSVLLGSPSNAGPLESLAHRLEETFGVTSLGAVFPVGWKETKAWIRKIAELTGREARGKDVLAEEEASLASYVAAVRARTAGKTAVIVTGRQLRWYDPAETAETLARLGMKTVALVLLDNLQAEDKQSLAEAFHRVSDAPVMDSKDAESVLNVADILLVSNQLFHTQAKQLFLPMVPLAGTAGELAMMRAIVHLVCRYGTKGGIAYVEA